MNMRGLETKGVGEKFWVVEFWGCGLQFVGCGTVLLGRCLLTSQRIYGALKFRVMQSRKTTCSSWPCIWRHH